MNISIPTLDELRELVAVSGNVDGENFEWGFEAWSETPIERRRELLAELLANVPDGVADSAPILVDVRTRDAYLRTFHDFVIAKDSDKVQAHLDGLLAMAQGSKGEVRGMALVCWAGCAWLLGNSDGIAVISELPISEIVREISLWQLLDIAIRHNVPSSVWGNSLRAVSLEACLLGAA
jgi:hypothetical protein